MLLSGDISRNPGPTADADLTRIRRTCKFPCVACGAGVTARSKVISCDRCESWVHIKCTLSITDSKYKHIVDTNEDFHYICDFCSLSELPFQSWDTSDTLDNGGFGDGDSGTLPQDRWGDGASVHEFDIPELLRAKGLHFFHANVRSLLPKLSEVRLFLERTKAATIAISETWLDDSIQNGEIAIDRYQVVRNDRNRHGGGVALYVKNGLAYNPRPDLVEPAIEATWIEVSLPRSKGFLICSINRPPMITSF